MITAKNILVIGIIAFIVILLVKHFSTIHANSGTAAGG